MKSNNLKFIPEITSSHQGRVKDVKNMMRDIFSIKRSVI